MVPRRQRRATPRARSAHFDVVRIRDLQVVPRCEVASVIPDRDSAEGRCAVAFARGHDLAPGPTGKLGGGAGWVPARGAENSCHVPSENPGCRARLPGKDRPSRRKHLQVHNTGNNAGINKFHPVPPKVGGKVERQQQDQPTDGQAGSPMCFGDSTFMDCPTGLFGLPGHGCELCGARRRLAQCDRRRGLSVDEARGHRTPSHSTALFVQAAHVKGRSPSVTASCASRSREHDRREARRLRRRDLSEYLDVPLCDSGRSRRSARPCTRSSTGTRLRSGALQREQCVGDHLDSLTHDSRAGRRRAAALRCRRALVSGAERTESIAESNAESNGRGERI